MALAGLYVERMELLYYHLPVLQESGDTATFERYLARIGEDMTRVREATDELRADENAGSRLRVIEAWSYFIQALEYEATRILFYETDVSDEDTTDDERAQAVFDEWTAEIDRALAVVEAAPLNGPDEKYAASFVYVKKALIHLFNNENEAAQEPRAMFVSLQTEVTEYYRERADHNQTLCADMREVERGDALSATGSYGPASEAYRAALDLNPENAHALNGLSYALYRDGDAAGAVEAARQATETYPDYPEAWARLGLYALAMDDAGTKDEAYGHFLELLSERPAQERIALAAQALDELQALLTEQPERGDEALDLLPSWRAFVDGISDAGDAYQYPQLYSDLGIVALLAGDAQSAEDLLRRGIELDARQPLAKVRLAMVVLIQGDSGNDEIQAVVDELNDPLWEEVEGVEAFGRDDLVVLAQAEIDTVVAARPEYQASMSDLIAAIEREHR